MDRQPRRSQSARFFKGLVLAGTVPVGVFLNGHLAGDELRPVPRLEAKPTFSRNDERVEPIGTAAPDSGVSLNSSSCPPKNVEDPITTDSERDQCLDELERSFNPVQELPLPETTVIAEPVAQEPVERQIEVKTVVQSATGDVAEQSLVRPEPVPERKINEVIQVESDASWFVVNAKPKFNKRALGPEEIGRLITRSRMELAAGDFDMAHIFAEAAAEVDIPKAVFAKKPERILSEIEHVTAGQQAVVRVAYDAVAEGESPNPNSPTQRLAKDPRGFRAIGKTGLNVRPKTVEPDGGAQQLPEPHTRRQLALLPEIVQQPGIGRGWDPVSYVWQAPAVYYSPLYYEEVELERYGNEYCGLQPIASGLHFYGTVFTLPYQMGTEGNGPFSCHYDFGHNRPGECVPFSIHALPFSWTGAVTQGAAATGLAFLIP